MSIVRPTVNVYSPESMAKPVGVVDMPKVFSATIRPDIVQFIHDSIVKNTRMPHGVKPGAGYQTSAESWGTGRAVSRIPRVPGGGTHRSGQAAFGNMCRGGGMFAPLVTWRRIHVRCPLTAKRHAVASAVAATGYPGIVMARGHLADAVPELPFVVEDSIQTLKRTKDAVAFLKRAGMEAELTKCEKVRRNRRGRVQSAKSKRIKRKGPLIVYAKDEGVTTAVRNIVGVETCHVSRLRLRQLAPGGTMGRLTIWTKSAFESLDGIYESKARYHLMRPIMANPDISRVVNSAEVQAVLNPKKEGRCVKRPRLNALTNPKAREIFDPTSAMVTTSAK